MGGGDLYVSSWGYELAEHCQQLDSPPWRRWSISWKNKRKCFITVPADVTIEQVMLMADAMVSGGNASDCVRHDWERLPLCDGCGQDVEPDAEHTFCYPGMP